MTVDYGSLPADWAVSRVDRVASVSARIGWKALTAAEYQPDGYAFLSTPNIKPKTIDFENVNYISQFRFDESPELKLAVGDVLLAKDGNTLGICNVVRTLPRPATVNGSIAVIRPTGIESRFLRYVLSSSAVQDHIDMVKDGMGVPHLFQRDINRIDVPLPSMGEQRRIADFLDAETARIDSTMSIRNDQRGLLVERRDAELSRCVTQGGVARHSHELLGGIGADWTVAHLRRFVPLINVGVVINPSTYFTEAGVPFIHGFNVRAGYIDLSNIKYMSTASNKELKRTQVKSGDVLVVRAGAPGRAAVVGPELNGANCASVLILRRSSLVDSDFLVAFFNSPAGRGQVTLAQYGAAQEVISAAQVSSFQIAVPSLDEQRRRALRLGEATKAISKLDKLFSTQIDRLKERRQALITAAVTGQFDVTTGRGADLS